MPKWMPFDGERASKQWWWLLTDIRRGGVAFNLNEGKRTLARQTQLWRNPPIINGRKVLVAFPSPNAPHIRTGRPDHAVDVTNSEAVIAAAKRRGVTLTRTVMLPGHQEPWHLEANAKQLKAYANLRRAQESQKRKALERHPAPKLELSERGVELIARFEGWRPYAYNDPVGLATVGYGHLIARRKVNADDIAKYGTKEHPKLSKAAGLRLLREDTRDAEGTVRTAVRVPLRQNEYDALVSLVVNIGTGNFLSSTVLRELNAGHRGRAGIAFLRWVKAGKPLRTLPGLVSRRAAERQLFRSREVA